MRRKHTRSEDKLGKIKLHKLHPMALPMLAAELKRADGPPQYWIKMFSHLIYNSPHLLKRAQIKRINSWVKISLASLPLDPPYQVHEEPTIESATVISVVRRGRGKNLKT